MNGPGAGRRTPRWAAAAVAALVLVVMVSGVAYALTRGSAPARTSSLGEAPAASESASASASPSPVSPSDVAETGEPTAPPVSTTVAPPVTASATDFALPVPCTPADLKLTVATDRTTYTQAEPISLDVHAVASATCTAAEPEVRIDGPAGGDTVWVTCHGIAPTPGQDVCTDSLRLDGFTPGKTAGAHYDWDMQTGPAKDGEPPTYLDAGHYTVTYTYGSSTATRDFVVDAAPTCTPDLLGVAVTTDKTAYHRGETAAITVQRTNITEQPCLLFTDIRAAVVDDQGRQVWSDCVTTGRPQGDSACAAIAGPPNQIVLTPGATHVFRTAWPLVHDGTADAGPGPVPDGTYAAVWGTASAKVTVTG